MKTFLVEAAGTNQKYFLKASNIDEAVIKVVNSRIDITGCDESDIDITVAPYSGRFELFNKVINELLYIKELKEMQL